MPITTRAVLVSFGVEAVIGVMLFSLFSALRISKYTGKFFCPRRQATCPRTPRHAPPAHNPAPIALPPA